MSVGCSGERPDFGSGANATGADASVKDEDDAGIHSHTAVGNGTSGDSTPDGAAPDLETINEFNDAGSNTGDKSEAEDASSVGTADEGGLISEPGLLTDDTNEETSPGETSAPLATEISDAATPATTTGVATGETSPGNTSTGTTTGGFTGGETSPANTSTDTTTTGGSSGAGSSTESTADSSESEPPEPNYCVIGVAQIGNCVLGP